jgi:hypothetical protein
MLKSDSPQMTLMLGALIAVAPLAMDIYLASMPSMTRALAATPEHVQLTLSVYMYGWARRNCWRVRCPIASDGAPRCWAASSCSSQLRQRARSRPTSRC